MSRIQQPDLTLEFSDLILPKTGLRVVYYSGQSWMLRMRGSKFHDDGKRYVY